MEKKVILITGASSGLGLATAKHLSSKGYMVIGTSRKGSSLQSFIKSKNEKKPFFITMDITNDQSIKDAITSIINKFSRIDVLINNAGIGISGSIEESSSVDSKKIFETNFFGTLHVTQKILPIMRKQQSGLIISMSSIGGVLGLPFQGLYSASKFALEGVMESLRMEVKKFGIKVVLVEPGDFKTSFTDNRKKHLRKSSAYYTLEKNATKVFEFDEQHGSDPIKVAHVIEKIIRTKKPRLRYRVGSFSQKFAAMLKGVISDRIVQWILMNYYKLK